MKGHHDTTTANAKALAQDFFQVQKFGERSTVLLGAHLPFIYFVVLLWTFTYTYHTHPGLPWFMAALFANVCFVTCFPPANPRPGGRSRWDWLPLVFSCVGVFGGVNMGIFLNNYMEPWYHARYLDHYDEVLPDSNPLAVFDAGVVRFAEGTRLDVSSSAGYKVWPNIYCAAPIVGDSVDSPVGFWAVGVNCCGNRGSFTCGDASDSEARSGLRIESHVSGRAAGHRVNENFLKAVKMSAAAYGLELPASQIMLTWERHPRLVAGRSWNQAFLFFCLSIMIGIAVTVLFCKVLMEVKKWQQ